MRLLLSLMLLSALFPARDNNPGEFKVFFETRTIRYVPDSVTGDALSKWGSNNYAKLDWQKDSLSAGLQLEWYPRALAGYPAELKGFAFGGLFAAWKHKGFELTAGSFYEQLGNGLLLRSWEDRDMGINNNLTGARALLSLGRWDFKLFAGAPKYGVLPTVNSAVGAFDIGVQALDFMRFELSVMDRMTLRPDPGIQLLASSGGFELPGHVPGWSARAQFSAGGFNAKAEYVGKGEDFYAEQLPGARESYRLNRGNAQMLELNYATGPFSGTLTFRRLENMTSRIFLSTGSPSVANTLNYLPSLCMQQTYLLAGLNPYVTFADGEAGLQGDLYYNFRKGTALGGRYGMKLHVGGSWIQALPCALPDRDVWYLAYRDINIDLERRWSRSLKTTMFVSIQENSPTHGNRKATNAQNVFVFDALYRFSGTTALRMELQYLYSQELTRDWIAALAELTVAPHWSVTLSDMYNHGSTGDHYFSVAAAYSLNSFNIAFTAGRSREGFVCSGGVCRWQPAFSGIGLRLQWSI